MSTIIYKCALCAKEFKNNQSLSKHISLYHKEISKKEYFDTYIDKGIDHKCPFCNNEKIFTSFGYKKTCGNLTCETKSIHQTMQEHYGYISQFSNNAVKEKAKQTMIRRYGSDNPFKIDSINEKIKNTMLEKYGTQHALQNNTCKEKAIKTCLSNYGVEHPLQSDSIKEKMKETNKQKYNVEFIGSSDLIREKIINTNLEKYGFECSLKNDQVKNKCRETLMKKYGVSSPMHSDTVKQKFKETCLEHFGVDNPTKSQKIIEKMKNTMLEKYGVDNYVHSDLYNPKHLIEYDNLSFDNNSEVIVYKFCKKNNLTFLYHPYSIEYQDSLNNKHFYHPDFEIEGKLYEIKGDHFFDENGKYRTPWVNGLSDKDIEKRNARDDAKYMCMLENDVTIILSSQITEDHLYNLLCKD